MEETRRPDRTARDQDDRRFQIFAIVGGSRGIDARDPAAMMTQSHRPDAGTRRNAIPHRRDRCFEHVPRCVEVNPVIRQQAPAKR